MAEITHRQMRNESAEVLRRVAAGETIVVTNNGRPAAIISPPPTDTLSLLIERGEMRPPLADPSTLLSITPRASDLTTAEIIADSRSKW